MKINYVWVSFISKFDQKENERFTLQMEGEKEMSMFAEYRIVEHDDFQNRRRTNCNDDRKIIRMDSLVIQCV